MSKFVHFRAQRDLNGAEITVTMTTERHKYTWPSTIRQQKTSPAAIMRPERAPRRAKMDPKNSQRVPKLPPGDKQCNFNDFLKLSGLFLEPFWVQNQSKNLWILVAKIDAQKANRLYAKNSLKRGIKTQFFGWWIQRFKPKYIMWKSLNSCRKTMFLKDQHVFEIWKNINYHASGNPNLRKIHPGKYSRLRLPIQKDSSRGYKSRGGPEAGRPRTIQKASSRGYKSRGGTEGPQPVTIQMSASW